MVQTQITETKFYNILNIMNKRKFWKTDFFWYMLIRWVSIEVKKDREMNGEHSKTISNRKNVII